MREWCIWKYLLLNSDLITLLIFFYYLFVLDRITCRFNICNMLKEFTIFCCITKYSVLYI
ncbi:MAG: hypothetical protein CML60_01495 [Rhodobacteraceae bacterium]|nr:hypothetical protein [Paracoccaceae bacterium]